MAGDLRAFGLAAVSPDGDSLAAAVSMRGAARASTPGVWTGCSGIGVGATVDLVWLSTLVEEGAVLSVSVVVEVERVLEEEANAGAKKVLDTAVWRESCEARKSGFSGLAMDAGRAASGASDGAMDM